MSCGALLSALALFLGCAEQPARAPLPAPHLGRAHDAIPADLDVQLRLDWARLREVFGERPLTEIELTLGKGFETPVRELLGAALPQTQHIWIGLRPTTSLDELDHVTVLEGAFKGIDPRSYRGQGDWGPAVDLGADYRKLDRVTPHRNEPARLYLHGNDELILATTAELDSVERQLDVGASGLEPPNDGAIAFAFRLTWLRARLRADLPRFSETLDGAETLSGFVDVAPSRLKLSASVACASPSDATSVASTLDLLIHELLQTEPANAALLRAVHLGTAADQVHIDLDVPQAVAQAWIGCVRTGQLSGCGTVTE